MAYIDKFINSQGTAYPIHAQKVISSLKGKKVIFLGASITAGSSSAPSYVPVVEELTECLAYNRGISGSGVLPNSAVANGYTIRVQLSNNDTKDGANAYIGLPNNPHVIIVDVGNNDWGHGKTLGEYGVKDTTTSITTGLGTFEVPTTFIGGLMGMLGRLRTKFPKVPIVLLGLHHTNVTPSGNYNPNDFSVWNESEGSYTMLTKSDKTMLDYDNAVRKCANLYGVYYIDMMNVGISPLIASDKSNYYTDGQHLNASGANVIGQYLAKQLDNLSLNIPSY